MHSLISIASNKVTAIAPANIAFIKYWGKADSDLRLPLNSSISMNLSGAYTTTTVEFLPSLARDAVELTHGSFSDDEIHRVALALDRIREKSKTKFFAKVVTKNSFPKSAGIASSASGFAALTVAAAAALGLTLPEKQLSILARLGSGSACRSIPDGFVLWEKGETSEDSYAHSLYPHTYWDLRDVLVIVDFHMKKISTIEGQEGVMTSPFWQDRVKKIPEKIEKTKKAFKEKNFRLLGEVIEEDCLNMHHVMQTHDPPLYYWNDMTKILMNAVVSWRNNGLPVYFTIDAGPNVHLIYQAKNQGAVIQKLKELSIKDYIINKPAKGAHLIKHHLF